jgi:hypothetical protein
MAKVLYKMKARVWLYPGETASWHFITLPQKNSTDIKAKYGAKKRGWGSLPVTVTIGKTSWETSIFPDKKSGGYLLPLKADVRKREGITQGDTINFTIEHRNLI